MRILVSQMEIMDLWKRVRPPVGSNLSPSVLVAIRQLTIINTPLLSAAGYLPSVTFV